MASIFSGLFSLFSGSGASKPAAPTTISAGDPQLHGDFAIFATPMKEGSQYRLAGRIEKDAGGEKLVRNFIRADVFSSADDAIECTFRKARQIIDQHGPGLFSDGEKIRQV